jgi:plasmid stabilization system protein ParE
VADLIWSPQAADDLEAICAFIAHDSDAYARDFAFRVIGAVEVLRGFPAAGRVVPEFRDPALRELLHGHYRIIHETQEDAVHILAIHHGARLLRQRPST